MSDPQPPSSDVIQYYTQTWIGCVCAFVALGVLLTCLRVYARSKLGKDSWGRDDTLVVLSLIPLIGLLASSVGM